MTTHLGILPIDVLGTISIKPASPDDGTKTCDTPVLRLPHPRTGIPSLFLPYQMKQSIGASSDSWGILEVQSVAPSNARSWLFTEGRVVADGRLLMMTPIDPAFLMIPLIQLTKPVGSFRPMEDVFEDAVLKMKQKSEASQSNEASSTISEKDITFLSTLDCIASAMKRVCETKDIRPELTVYRYSEEKVTEYLKTKVARLAKADAFEQSKTIIRKLAKDGLMDDGKEDILEQGRLRAACDLISQYVPSDIYTEFLATYDFGALDAHVKALQDEAAAAALAAAPLMKSKNVDKTDGDGGKKRKAKTKASQGVEKLKKANVSGMSKISTFFQQK